MGVVKFKGEEQGQETQAIATPRLSFMSLCVEVGLTVPGRPRTGGDAGPHLAGPPSPNR